MTACRLRQRVVRSGWLLMALATALGLHATVWAGQPLETESARLLKRGQFEFESGLERQTSSAGTEAAVPFALEYGVTDRIGLLIEPVLYTAIHDRGIPRQTGIGDFEVTLTTLLSHERPGILAFAIGAEAKVPTARNPRIGSGKADYTLYLIGSKRLGRWDTHANVGYTIVGHPAGTEVSNVINYALGEDLRLNSQFDVVGEVFGSTGALKEGADAVPASGESRLTPEIGGGETVGALGLRFHATGSITCSLGLSLDSKQAVLVHPGFAVKW